jgi:hypothetical protein
VRWNSLSPFLARHLARELAARHPALQPEEIGAKMLVDLGRAPTEEEERLVRAAVAGLAPAAHRHARPNSPSTWVLVAANLVPLAGVLFLDWSVFALMALFWMENVVIGVFFILRMICAHPDDLDGWGWKLFLVPFFCFHYGIFTAVHGGFVFALFGGADYGFEMPPLKSALRAAQEQLLWLPLAALVASHLFSFGWNYLYRGEFRTVNALRLMLAPYARVVVLHLALIVGGFGLMALGSPLWALLLLLALKIGLDMQAHVKEHATRSIPRGKGFLTVHDIQSFCDSLFKR